MRTRSFGRRLSAAVLLGLAAATLTLSACTDPFTRYNTDPAYRAKISHDQQEDKKGNGCLKC